MARAKFGGTIADGVYTPVEVSLGRQVLGLARAKLTLWDDEQGGTQHTDLLDANEQPVTEVVTDYGRVPVFYGPDGVVEVWADDGDGGPRVRMVAEGRQGPVGPEGPEGPQGLPATNAAEDDAAIATFASTPGTATHDALTDASVARTSRAKHAPALGLFFPEAEGAVGDGTVDDTAAVNACLATMYAAGGGTMHLGRKYRCDGQVIVPNSSAGTVPGNQPPMRITASGAAGPRIGNQAGDTGVLDLRYSGGAPKFITKGYGVLTIERVRFVEGTGDALSPFIFCSLTTLRATGNTFFGNATQTVGNNTQDAIVLGGKTSDLTLNNTLDSPFQGYGTVIKDNAFDYIRRGVWGRNYVNGVQIRDNTWWANCGGDSTAAAIHLDPDGTVDLCRGNVISGNLIEMPHYAYGIRLDYAQGNFLDGNQFWDGAHPGVLACYYLGVNAFFNTISTAINNGVAANVAAVDAITRNANTILYAGGTGSDLGNSFHLSAFLGVVEMFSELRFGALATGARVPPDVTLKRIGAGRLQCDGRFSALGTQHDFGPATNAARIGSLGTGDIWVDASGSNATINLRLRAKGAGTIQPQSDVVMAAGKVVRQNAGPTASRPVLTGSQTTLYFDTTLGKPIFWSGTGWVDASGATV